MYTNLQDAAGNQSASKAALSSSNQNKTSGQQQMDKQSANQNSTEVNGSLIEDRKNLKHLPIEDVLEKVKSVVAELEKFEEFNKPEVMQLQKCLGDFYWDYTSHRKQIGDAIADAGYAAITVRILKGLNTIGIFKNDDVWFPTYYTYNTTWNYSDCSELLARNLAEADAVRLLTLNCGHKPYLNAVHSKNVYYVIKASMSILHNIARNPTAKTYFKENKTSEVIMPFITMNDDMLKVLAMLTLAYIVEEEDNVKLIDETGTIKNIVQWIEKALDSPKRRFKGFCPMELTQGLDKLAVNDGNKSRIIDEGAIPLFMKMLLHDDPREHSVTARCIWTLSFDKGVKQKFIDYQNLVPTLEKLADSSDKEVHKNASGALWILKGEIDPTSERPKSAVKAKSHIFISYSWTDQKQAKEILDRLKAEGYSVWIDIEQMGGSTLEAMAGAIENAAVVLVCMSEKYKQSPNCRTEAEYTFQLRKDYIPLMMQKKYRPDGWLGLILGAKLFFDFSGKYPFEKSMSGLLKELRGRGQKANLSVEPSVDEVDGPSEVCTTVDTLKANPHRSTHPYTSSAVPGNAQMTRDDVQKWLMGNQLENCMTLFNQFDGRLVWQLKEMKQEAPEYFYQCLEKRLNLGLIDMLKLAAALDQLH
ncbi:uncharacterized protein LOC121373745 [Gigantopelta aegis]|uniref:uncharacterized protein LOC121373745 n=1 Tax=Gigantopelta aegis TaxID=1735272 RepID=UPI001B8886D1|nr:uncharacterized protein LOC121373745 [Gigantopelta aegis]